MVDAMSFPDQPAVLGSSPPGDSSPPEFHAAPPSPSSGASSSSEPAPESPALGEQARLLQGKFRDFDDQGVYKFAIEQFMIEDAKNFVMVFGKGSAKVANDLGKEDFVTLMENRDVFPAEELPVRWINIWNPSCQKEVIETIGHRYNFSKRLILSMWAWDKAKAARERRAGRQPPAQKHSQKVYNQPTGCAGSRIPSIGTAPILDLEKGRIGSEGDNISDGLKSPIYGPDDLLLDPENAKTFALMQSTIDYTSIDVGDNFICFGANWLHNPPYESKDRPKELVPPKHWSWFALFNDNTVLSVHESYYKSFSEDDHHAHPDWQEMELRNSRANTLKVFRQLSRQGQEEDMHKIMQLTSVRDSLSSDEHRKKEGAGNTFYYLFEDYSATLSILLKTKSYLEEISQRVLNTDEWKQWKTMAHIIPDLYKLNKDLRQLNHLFTNYSTLIGKIINRDYDEAPVSSDARASAETVSSTLPVLSKSALNRFKRLQVQLQSLMLDTIKDYLDEKESLQNTYFNLINQKDSQATERLTRNATLLAKLSVFFLPISFMTSYFSIQVEELNKQFTKWAYWGSFIVIASLSFFCLFFFSKFFVRLSDWLDRLSDGVEKWLMEKTGWGKPTRKIKEI